MNNSPAQWSLARRCGCDFQPAQKAEPTLRGLVALARTLLLLVPLLLATPGRAAAYADPGTGAFLYQAAYAAFLGGSFYLRRLLDRFVRGRRDRKESQLLGSR